MKRNIKSIVLLVALLLSVLLTSCAQQVQDAEASPSAEASASPSETGSDVQDADTPETVEIVDAAGRTMAIPAPDKLERLYPTGTASFVILYMLAPDKITASATTISEEDKKYYVPQVYDLPNYGTLSGKGTLNYEAIKAGDVQVMLSSCSGEITQETISSADEMQEQLGIPVVILSTDLDKASESFEILGRMLGREEDAEKLTDYISGIMDEVTAIAAQVPEEDRPTLYYAEGADGLATEPAGSSRSIVFDTAGAINIAEVDALSGFGQSSVSMEQVLSWNPEVIIVQGYSGAYDSITTDPNWSTIDAVQNGRVYVMPSEPFSWADRPPSFNRFIGLYWMSYVLYPELCDFDMVEVAQDYYKTMYHVDISSEDMEALLVHSMPDNG